MTHNSEIVTVQPFKRTIRVMTEHTRVVRYLKDAGLVLADQHLDEDRLAGLFIPHEGVGMDVDGVIYVKMKEGEVNFKELSHECLHATHHILILMGFDLNNWDISDLITYTHEHIVELVEEKVSKKYPIIRRPFSED